MNRDKISKHFSTIRAKNFMKTPGGLTHYGPLLFNLKKEYPLPYSEETFKTHMKNRAFKELRTQTLIEKIDHSFRDEKIDLILLKGLANAHLYWPIPLERSFGDIDILVRDHDFTEALEILSKLGGEPEEEKGKWEANQFKKVYIFEEAPVELHSQVLVYRDYNFFDEDSLSPQKLPFLKHGKVLAPEVNLVYLCGHGAFQHLFDEYYWLLDIDLLINKHDDLNWEKVLKIAKTLKLEKALGLSLSLVQKHFDTKIDYFSNKKLPGNMLINKLYPLYVRPDNIFSYSHREGTLFYLLLKALLRDSLREIIRYSFKRFRRG